MLDMMYKVSNQFISFSVRKGDVVCFFVNDVDVHAIASMALIAVGGVYTGVDYNYPVDEVIYHLKQSGARYLVINDQTLDIGIEVVEQISELELNFRVQILFLGSKSEKVLKILNFHPNLNIKFLLNFGHNLSIQRPSIKIDPELDLAVIGYSSGSTGRPKAIRKNHRSIVRHVNIGSTGFEFSSSKLVNPDVNLIKARFGHSNPLILLFVSIVSGSKTVLYDPYSGHFDELFLKYVQQFKVTSSFLLPSTVHFVSKMMTIADVRKYDLSSLIDVTVGGSVLSHEMAKDFIIKTNIKHFRQCYGSTDAGWLTINPVVCPTIKDVGTIGVPLPGCALKVIDTITGEPCPALKEGEIYARGPQMMLNCYVNHGENQINFKDGYLKMGDIGYYNLDGQFFLNGRIKQVIKCCGLQVSSSELESLLMNHSMVIEAAVIGTPDPDYGEVPKAFVKLDMDTSNRLIELKVNNQKKVLIEETLKIEKEIISYLASLVAPHKQLKGGMKVLFDEDFPRTVIGKIDKKQLN